MKKPVCFGAGLVALDVILNGSPTTLPKLSTGGSCGNVLTILAFLGWDSYPIARLSNNRATNEIVRDLERWNIHIDYLSCNTDGRTPIIIHRIKRNKLGKPVHRFEFRDPQTGRWLPQFKPITKHVASKVLQANPSPQVFYLDRLNPGSFELAKSLKVRGAIICFEPSSINDRDQFEKFLGLTDILKFSHERIPDYKTHFKSARSFLEIETRGKDGLLYRSKSHSNPHQWHSIPGFFLEEIEDAAGAGDWCTAGIIHSLCANEQAAFFKSGIKRIQKALQFGSALGAMNCLYDGARGLMYHYTPQKLLFEVDRFILNRQLDKQELIKLPSIDISTKLNFSDLYKLD